MTKLRFEEEDGWYECDEVFTAERIVSHVMMESALDRFILMFTAKREAQREVEKAGCDVMGIQRREENIGIVYQAFGAKPGTYRWVNRPPVMDGTGAMGESQK